MTDAFDADIRRRVDACTAARARLWQEFQAYAEMAHDGDEVVAAFAVIDGLIDMLSQCQGADEYVRTRDDDS